ncbi:MAG: alpha/beta fold hydrolase [Anaerolineae bacterium]
MQPTYELSKAFQGEEHQPFFLHGSERQAALLVHGFPGTPAEMRPFAQVLHTAGWTVQGVLLPGFGPDIETLAERTHAEWLTAVRTALRDLQAEYEHVILVGHSMGGALCIEIAATAPTPPQALILFAPFWKLTHVLWEGMPVLKYLFPQPRIFRVLNLDFNDPEVRAGIHNFMPDIDLDDPQTQQAIRDFPVPVKMFAQIYEAGRNAHRLAPMIRIPALVFQGQADELVRPHLTMHMVKRFGGEMNYHALYGEHNIISPTTPDWPKITQYALDFLKSHEWVGTA